jgi:DNA helicase HerA-like ATPase
MLDEAHRFANRGHDSDEKKSADLGDGKSLVTVLGQYVRETRKFGIGWMFVTTSLADMDESIVNQTGVRVFGYGLNMGNELERFSVLQTRVMSIFILLFHIL